jgi:CDP-glucose 4,6-dehydratase
MLNEYKNKTVLITGNTGFVGSNLCLFLQKLGANIIGYSHKTYLHYDQLALDMVQYIGDIRDFKLLKNVINNHKIDLVVHLAAQPLVKTSYLFPRLTYDVNVNGTLNLLEILKQTKKVPACINVTTDKVYKNKEQMWGYKEDDELGGYDPYSSSKSVSELFTETYRNCFFSLNDYKDTHNTLIATARAGNILGMGDFGEYRLIPDVMKAWSKDEVLSIRSPYAIRPWSYVLDIIRGYLMLGSKLMEGEYEFAEAWNFSSNLENMITVKEVLMELYRSEDRKYIIDDYEDVETNVLRLDSTKAKLRLGWEPQYGIHDTLYIVRRWYKEFYETGEILTEKFIDNYLLEMKSMKNTV